VKKMFMLNSDPYLEDPWKNGIYKQLVNNVGEVAARDFRIDDPIVPWEEYFIPGPEDEEDSSPLVIILRVPVLSARVQLAQHFLRVCMAPSSYTTCE
jgi:hypothetical protein